MNTNQKILIIEDEKPLLFGLTTLMKRQGYDVISADNGELGLSLAQQELPDVIISDVMMPPPNGFELRELLNQNTTTASIPFIFLTALTKQEEKLHGIRLGADDYVTKPFELQELMARVDALLRRRDIERQNGRSEMENVAKEEMEKLKSGILENLSHELRTPMVNILLPLEAAVSNKFTNPEDLIRFTQIALSNAARLDSLVEDFLLLTYIDQGTLSTIRQEINPQIDITKPIQKRVGLYEEKNLTVDIILEVHGPIYAPRNEFKKVIIHLVDNAFKFSPTNGKVTVKVTAPGDGGCTLHIIDEGSGIPEDVREKVFERYYQHCVDEDQTLDGMGLGLPIAQAVMQSLGGEVEIVESITGCVIRVSLPPGKNDFLTPPN